MTGTLDAGAEAAVAHDPGPRARLYRALLRFPGLHLAALAREAAVEDRLARYHIAMLERRGLAVAVVEGSQPRFFPRKPGEVGPQETVGRDDKRVLAALRRPVPLTMVVALLVSERGTLTMTELAHVARVSPPTATYHVKRLVDAGIVTSAQHGRERDVRLVEPDRLAALLARFPPPHDMVEGFLELWDKLDL